MTLNTELLFNKNPAAGGYTIDRSLRFNSADSAYLSRTPTSAGNRKTWTWSGWVKRSKLNNQARLFNADTSNTDRVEFMLHNETENYMRLELLNGTSDVDLVTSQVFRDTSSWYHIVLAVDTTQSTSSNRVKIYVNGAQITSFSTTTYPNQNAEYAVNATTGHSIGRSSRFSRHFDGYLADVIFVDGQALDPTSFGEFDTNGVWNPIEYTGNYGTNGFHLDFADNSSTTSGSNVGIGKDVSGSGNYFNSTNISVTAGAGNDSLRDSPTNGDTANDTGLGGQVPGNYCTWNPLCRSAGNATITNGNLDLAVTLNDYGYSGTIFVPDSGKWYFEVTLTATSGNGPAIGIVSAKAESSDMYDSSYASGLEYGGPVYAYNAGQGTKMSQNASDSYVASSSPSVNDTFMVAVDFDNGAIYFGKNGTWLNSGVPTSGASKTGAAFTSIEPGSYSPVIHAWGTGITGVLNAGARAFAYTAPSGFKALCTVNLPTPTIEDPSTVFETVLWQGDGTNNRKITTPFSPDFVWAKFRNQSYSHGLYDTVRGDDKRLVSNSDAAEGTVALGMESDGFVVEGSSSYNDNNDLFVAWTWDAGSSTVSNTDGSITSSVRANASAGFSIVTYTGNATQGASVGHGLGVAPSMIIVKSRSSSTNWAVGHSGLGGWNKVLYLNLTDSVFTQPEPFNGTTPTSTVFQLWDSSSTNSNGANYVAYCFAPVAGYSAFGSYVGNNLADPDQPFIYTGFRPRWLLIRRSNVAAYWNILDTARDSYNVALKELYPNDPDLEQTVGGVRVDFVSNGFKIRVPQNKAAYNASGDTYIYCAFASHPFQTARAR